MTPCPLNALALALAVELERPEGFDPIVVASLMRDVPAGRDELFGALVQTYRWVADVYGLEALQRAGLHIAAAAL